MKVGQIFKLETEFCSGTGFIFKPGSYRIVELSGLGVWLTRSLVSRPRMLSEIEFKARFSPMEQELPIGAQQLLAPLQTITKCECGVAAVGTDKHSTWCPLCAI